MMNCQSSSPSKCLAQAAPYGGLTLMPSAFVKDISVDRCTAAGDHFEFVLTILGATRFLHVTARTQRYIRYTKVLRYSALLELHHALAEELAPYLKAEGAQVPEFPSKSWFSSGKKLAEKRVVQLNDYFARLFNKYAEVLLFSRTLIDFFEPQRIDLSIVGCGKCQAKEYVRALAFLVANMEIAPDAVPGFPNLCEPRHNSCTKEVMQQLCSGEKQDFDWENYLPFDFKYKGQLFRVDVQNLYAADSVGESDCIISLYQTQGSACVIALDMTKRSSFVKAKETLGNIKLFLTEGGYAVPPFVVVGFGHEQTRHEVTAVEVNKYLVELFGDPCPYRYVEVSCVTGHQVLGALEALIDNAASAQRSPQSTPK